jgi:hypothetical protein
MDMKFVFTAASHCSLFLCFSRTEDVISLFSYLDCPVQIPNYFRHKKERCSTERRTEYQAPVAYKRKQILE